MRNRWLGSHWLYFIAHDHAIQLELPLQSADSAARKSLEFAHAGVCELYVEVVNWVDPADHSDFSLIAA
jgi:hypothetical protein